MGTKLFVGGLSWDTTDDSLKNFFASAGNVVSANVIVDKMSGRSKGFGFVEMSTEAEATEAMNKNGQELDGRTIAVSEARPQQPRENRYGGGGAGGGGGYNRNRGGDDRRGGGRGGNRGY